MNPGGAFERRWRDLGHGRFTLRLKRGSVDVLDALCKRHQCNRRDVIEGLLLGTIKPDAKLALVVTERLSPAEAAAL